MISTFEHLIDSTIEQLEESPIKNILGDALKESLEKQKTSFQNLLVAKEQNIISQEEFEAEIEREKAILEAEMLTKQITAKAVVQNLVNDAIRSLTKGLV